MGRKFEDLSGKKYPLFSVVKPVYKNYQGNKKLYWECLCRCGNTFMATKSSIKSGKVQSCGCYQKEYQRESQRSKRKVHIDDTFGILHVEGIEEPDRGKSVYICRCECGNVIRVSGSHIRGKYSCGCLTSGYLPESNVKSESFVHIGKKTVRNTSGCVGVSWKQDKQKWKASIYFNGKSHHIGYYDNYDDAVKARKTAENEIYNKYQDHIDKLPNKNNSFSDINSRGNNNEN